MRANKKFYLKKNLVSWQTNTGKKKKKKKRETALLHRAFNVDIKASLEGVNIDLSVDSFTDQCTLQSRPASAIKSINLSN